MGVNQKFMSDCYEKFLVAQASRLCIREQVSAGSARLPSFPSPCLGHLVQYYR